MTGPSRIAYLVPWLLLVLLGGCARLPQGALTPLQPEWLETRVALERPAADDDPLEHARAVMESELTLGRPRRAADAALTMLRRAESAWWMARLAGDEDATEDALRQLHRAAREALRMAERTGDDELTIAAVVRHPHPKRHRRALRRALASRRLAVSALTPTMVELVGDDPIARHHLVRIARFAEGTQERLGLTEIEPLPSALDLLEVDLSHAVEESAPRTELRARAVALRAADPWHVEASLVLLSLDEIAAGTLTSDPMLLQDIIGQPLRVTAHHPAQARLTLRMQAHPTSAAMPLGLAWRLLERDLVGDAHAVLEAMTPPSSELASELHAQLRARTAALRGNVAAFEHWRIEGRVRSVSLDHWLASREDPSHGVLEAAARRARRRGAEVGRTTYDPVWLWRVVLDEHVSEDARALARAELDFDQDTFEVREPLCRELGLDGRSCALMWEDSDVATLLQTIGRTRNFHPGLLDDAYQLDAAGLLAAAPAIEAYADTVIEASAEAQSVLLRLELARGEHAKARTRLDRHGDLLEPWQRTWAWLVLDDLEAGRLSFDEAERIYVPGFSLDPPFGSERTVPASRAQRYMQAMLDAQIGEDAEALEQLQPILDELPDEVVAAGLAQAALCAHRTGDAALRDALRQRLRDADPHGVDLALLQAHLLTNAGQAAEARRFLAHALRWHPEHYDLYRAMLDTFAHDEPASAEDALAYAAQAGPRYDYDYEELHRAITEGHVRTLDELYRVRAGIDGETADAWSLGPQLLAHLPSTANIAVAHGERALGEATDLATARQWAVDTLELLETLGVDSDRKRRSLLWLALLTGRAEAGLVHAREHVPGSYVPLSESDAVLLLLRSRAAGEIDDELAWDLWRWAYGTDDEATARVEALLTAPPAGSIFEVFACGELTTRDDLGPAFPVCEQAWRSHPSSGPLAVSQMFLALNHPALEDGERLGSDVLSHGTPQPDFADDPGLSLAGGLAVAWHQNRAVWMGDHGLPEAAAESWWQAYAFGLEDEVGQLRGHEQLRWRGPQVRALADSNVRPRTLHVRHALMALSGAEPVAARGYAEAAATLVPEEPGTLTRDELMLPDQLRHLARWAEADLSAGHVPPEAMDALVDQVLSPTMPDAQRLHESFPESSLAQLARLSAHRELDELDPARALAEALVERHPDDPLAVAAAVPLRLAAGDDEGARALYDASHAAHPRDAMLLFIDAPESITGPRDGVPAWARDPERFDARVAAVTDARVRRLVPVRHASDERAAELFVPRAWTEFPDRPLRFTDEHGARILVLTSPRASRCQGADCARDLLEGVGGDGRTRQWTRQVPFGGGEATQAMLTNAEEVLVAWVLPTGGRVFTLVVAAPVDRFEQVLPALVMARDGLRPLDAVLPPFPAESLRAAGPTLRDGWRLRGRREQLRAEGEGCPVAQTLAALPHEHQRSELLVDLWLGTADAEGRHDLLRCARARDATARRIALVALLDEDPRIHAFGQQAVLTHATRVESDVRTIASTPLTPPVSAPDYLTRDDLPARGLVEVLGALPEPAARRLVERLLASADPRDHTLAWAGLRLRPELASDEIIDAGLRGAPEIVTEAAFLLSDRGRPEDLERLRDHLAGISTAADEASQDRLRDLSVALATGLDPADATRLSDALAKVSDGDDAERAKRLRDELRELAREHARGVELLRDPSLAITQQDGRPVRWRDQRLRRELPPRPLSDLRHRSLAELLPGRHWTFARLAAPGLFSSTVADVAERLTTGDEAIDQRLSDLTGRVLREGGFAALSRSGGLDASKPIECATPAHGYGWLCTARVTDREALLAVLGQRAHGDDAGLSLPMSVATTAGIVPLALSLMPAILHPLVYPDEDDEDDDGPAITDVAAERARITIDVGGIPLELYSIVDVTTERISIDSERYLFVDDRLWVFSTDEAMERAMRRHEGPVLADDPEFSRLTAGWQDGAALQAVALGHAWPLAEGGASMEVVLDEDGLRFRYAGAFESESGVGDIAPALAQLPDGAVTIFAHGLGQAPSWLDEELSAEGPDAARVPPLPVLAAAPGVAFGWYLEDGDRLWRRWLAVTPLDAAVRKALRSAKTPPGRGRSRRHGGLCYRERSGYLLVGDCALVDRSAAGPEPPPPSADQLRVGHGTFDGVAAAERLPGLGGLSLDKKATLRIVAPLLGIVTDLEVQASWTPAERMAVLEGQVGLRLRPPGDRSRVIDDWLAATEGRNAAALPRRLRDDEIEGPLAYLIEVPDAEAFVRDTLADSPRIETEVLGPTRVRVTVSPVPRTPRPVALSEDERKRLTKRTSTLRSDDPRIIRLARSIVPEGTAPQAAAEAVAQWVHERIAYEVTPRTLDGVEILDAGRGDCTEYATLTVTLLRALDVPAEVRDGMAASGDELVAHAWVGYHDGTAWREIDPTWGRPTASAGHLEMSVLDVLALISLGRLTVVEIDGP